MTLHFWPTFYLVCTLATVLLAWVSGSNSRQKLALIMVVGWIQQNVWTVSIGFANAPVWIASSDLVLMLLSFLVAYAHRSYAGALLVALFGIRSTVHLSAHLSGWQGNYLYYASLNVIFLLQLLVVGGSSIDAIAHKPRGASRFGDLRFGGLGRSSHRIRSG